MMVNQYSIMTGTLAADAILSSQMPLTGTFMMDSLDEDISFGESECINHDFTIINSSLGKLDFNGFRGHIEFIGCRIRQISFDERIYNPNDLDPPFKITDCMVKAS